MSTYQLFGAAMLAVGLVSLLTYAAPLVGLKLPVRFWKLEAMRQRWGRGPGTVLHVLGYVLSPIVFGVALLLGYTW